MLTLLERKSLYLWLKPLTHRTAQATAETCISVRANVKPYSVTFNNGKEFTQHVQIATGTGADIYFADACQSNQRARNENGNGLMRQ